MGHHRGTRLLLAVALALAALAATGATAAAAERSPDELVPIERPAPEEHCVAHASGVDADGFLIVSEPICGSDLFASAMSNNSLMSRSATYTLGRHFSSTGYSGSSITITGSVPCGGGVWKPTGFWSNNIESTLHYCGAATTRFYDSSSCSGWSQGYTSSASSLGAMNNRASCVRYG